MAELPPPYEGAVSAVAVSPSVVVSPAPERHPSPPPSYETAVWRDRPQALDGQQSRRPASSGSPRPSLLSVQPARRESDRHILERVLHKSRSSSSSSSSRGTTRDRLAVALHDTALAGDEAAVQALLRAHAPIVLTDSCALHAALRGAAPHLAVLIADAFWARACEAATTADPVAEADARTRALLDARDANGCTPLHMAAQAGATDAVRALLARGAAVDPPDRLGRTPLHMAARYGRVDAAAVLLASRADGHHLLLPVLWERAAAEDRAAGSSRTAARTTRGRSGTASRLAELGDFAYIGRLLRPLLADVYKTLDALGQTSRPTTAAPFQPLDPLPEWDGIACWDVPGAAAGPSHSPSSSSSASVPTSASALTPAELLLRALPPSLLLASSRRHQAPRKHLTSTLHSPQYGAWSKGCDTLLAEHRAQRERNRLADVPKGMQI